MAIFINALLFFLLFSSPLFAFDLEGKIALESPLPEAPWLEVPEKHQKECGARKLSPKLRLSPEGWVANAVVKLDGNFPTGRNGAVRRDFLLDQIGCEFSPHLLLLPQGAALKILNSEAMLHNVRAFNERVEMLFNDAMPKKGQVLKKRFDEPGRFVVRCGIHHWMHAILVVTEHPFYAVTDAEGHFKIEGIPDGTYPLSVWHELLGELKLRVGPGSTPLTVTYPLTLNPLPLRGGEENK